MDELERAMHAIRRGEPAGALDLDAPGLARAVDAYRARAVALDAGACGWARALAIETALRDAFLARRRDALAGVAEDARAPAPSPGEGVREEWARIAAMWATWRVDARAPFRDPAARVEAAALGALVQLEHGDPDAVAAARRASRMARSEGLPEQEWLAHFVLARARRRQDRPAAAIRILSALAEVAPEAWQPFVQWETVLAGGTVDAPRGFAAELVAVLAHADRGDRAGFDGAASELAREVAGEPMLASDLDALLAGLDPASARTPPWATGASERIEHGLLGLGASARAPGIGAWVLATPQGARRVLARGLGLAGALHDVPTSARVGRLELALSVVALAGAQGLSVDAFFVQVYGFRYRKDQHDGAFRVLLHRMRQTVDACASIARDGEQLRLELRRAFAVPDPRTEIPLGERVLRQIARERGVGARALAASLEVPLRTIQVELARLVEDGACEPAPDGSGYVVEDTTFSDPTALGLRLR